MVLPFLDELCGCDACLLGNDGCLVWTSPVQGRDRDQRQAEVADLVEQAVQGGLIDRPSADGGGSVAFIGEAQDLQPGRPSRLEVAPQTDLVEPDLLLAASPRGCLAHGVPP